MTSGAVLRFSRHPDLVALGMLGLIALALRAAFLLRAPAFITNDSHSYLLPGFDLVTGLTFEPIYKRPPAYSLVNAAALWFFGQQSLHGLLVLQHLCGVLTVWLAYGLGATLFGRPAGWLAGLLTALSGPLIIAEHYIMSETQFGLLLAAALLTTIVALRHRNSWLLAAGAVLLGLAALTRPVAQMLVPLIAVLALVAWPRWRPGLLAAVVMVACYTATVLPWMVRNAAVQQSFTVAGGLGEGLAVRTIRLDQEFDFSAPPNAPDRLRREREIFRQEARQGSVFELAKRLREEARLSPAAADRAMRDIALDAIMRKPLYYLTGSFDMFLKMFAGRPVRLRQDWEPWRGIVWEDRVEHLKPAALPEQDRQFETAQTLVTIYDPARWSLLLAILFVVGCLAATRHPDFLLALLPAIAAFGLLLASAYLVGIEWRYRYPLDPLIHVTVAGGVMALVRAITPRLPAFRPT